jgi:hypothetical protein
MAVSTSGSQHQSIIALRPALVLIIASFARRRYRLMSFSSLEVPAQDIMSPPKKPNLNAETRPTVVGSGDAED